MIAKHNESLEQHKQLSSNSQEIEHLKLVIEKYRRMIFGRKSEKLTRELEQLEFVSKNWRRHKLQTRRFNEDNEAAASPNSDSKRDLRVQGASLCLKTFRVKWSRIFLRTTAAPIAAVQLRQFGEDVSEQLERIPATYKVIRHVRPKFACGGCDRVVEAPAPARPIAYGLAGPDLLAHVLVSKYADHCRFIDSQRSMPARASILIAQHWPDGSARQVSCWRRWSMRSRSMCWRHRRSMPMTHRFLCLRRQRQDQDGRLWTYVRDDRPAAGYSTAPQSGSPTRRIARANIPDWPARCFVPGKS